jgi:hypothetical protein
MTNPAIPLAIGHLRNATFLLFSEGRPDQTALALECLDLEALLSEDDVEPALVPAETTASASIIAARGLLASRPEDVPPAAWARLHSMSAKLG